MDGALARFCSSRRNGEYHGVWSIPISTGSGVRGGLCHGESAAFIGCLVKGMYALHQPAPGYISSLPDSDRVIDSSGVVSSSFARASEPKSKSFRNDITLNTSLIPKVDP